MKLTKRFQCFYGGSSTYTIDLLHGRCDWRITDFGAGPPSVNGHSSDWVSAERDVQSTLVELELKADHTLEREYKVWEDVAKKQRLYVGRSSPTATAFWEATKGDIGLSFNRSDRTLTWEEAIEAGRNALDDFEVAWAALPHKPV